MGFFLGKNAQVSLEMMYAVGTMVIIFMIITGVNIHRRFELREYDEFSSKVDRCYELADKISGVYTLGEGGSATFYTRQYIFDVVKGDQAVTVTEENPEASTVIASCTFVAPISTTITLQKLTTYTITNRQGVVTIE